ncbi:MAG: hypothetical protein WC712_03345, partial [Candidatus Brocadiia bacterium]
MRVLRTLFAAITLCAALAAYTPSAFAFPATVTDIAGYNEGDYNGGKVQLIAVVDGALPFTIVYFEYFTSTDSQWHSIGLDSDGTDGYSLYWDTGNLTDFGSKIRATADTVGAVTTPREENILIVNIVPDSISGYTNPDEGTLDLSSTVTPPKLQNYFPPNPWTMGTSQSYSWWYFTVVDKDPGNASQVSGTVIKFTTYIGTGSNYYSGWSVYLKLFSIDPATNMVTHIWTSSTAYTPSIGSSTDYTVNVPNVPMGTHVGLYFYYCYPSLLGYTGNTVATLIMNGDQRGTNSTSNWSTSSECCPARAYIERLVDYPTRYEFGYSVDGGTTIVPIAATPTDQGGGNWTVTFDTAAAGLQNRNFILAARAHNGGSWCTWFKTDPFILTNDVSVTVKTSLTSGSFVTVDGSDYTGSYTGTWKYFAAHDISVPQYSGQTPSQRWAFDSWSDLGTIAHSATVENPAGKTITATYAREYMLTVNSSQTFITGSTSGFYKTGTAIQIIAEAEHQIDNFSRYHCTGWTSPQIGNSTGSTCQFNITQATTIGFIWVLEYLLDVKNDLYSATGATKGWYAAGSVIETGVPAFVSAGIGVRYQCLGYTGSGSLIFGDTNSTGPFTLSIPTTVNWNWDKQYELKVETNAGTPIGSGWFKEGTNATADITLPNNPLWERYTFSGWSGSGSGSVTTSGPGTGITVTMSGPIREFAAFQTEFYLLLENVGSVGGFAPDVSGWYDGGSVVTATLAVPPTTPVLRYAPEWRGTGAGSANMVKSIGNPRQMVFTMNGPIHQLVEWFAQDRFDVLNPTGYGEVSPVEGHYWFFRGETVVALASTDGANYLCTGYTGTGSAPSGSGITASFDIFAYSTITWNWAPGTTMPAQYWYKPLAIGPKMTTRAIDVDGAFGDVSVVLYDDTQDSIVLLQNTSAPKVDSQIALEETTLANGTGPVSSLDLVLWEGGVYVTYVTETGDVYLLQPQGNLWIPVLMESNAGAGVRSAIVVDSDGAIAVFYRRGVFGDLVQRVYDNTLGQWVTSIIDSDVSSNDLVAKYEPASGRTFLAYRKGLFLYQAATRSVGWLDWEITQSTDSGNAGHDLSLAVDPSGAAYVSYTDIANFRGSQLYSAYGIFGRWSFGLVDPTTGAGMGTSTALDEGDHQHITSHSETTVRYSRFNGMSWENAIVADSVVADGPTFVLLKDDGRPMCVFFNDGVPMLAEAKATPESNDGGGGGGGGDGGGNGGGAASGGGGGCFVA